MMDFQYSDDPTEFVRQCGGLWHSKAVLDEVIQHATSKEAGGDDASPLFVTGAGDSGVVGAISRLTAKPRRYASFGYVKLPSFVSPVLTILASGLRAANENSAREFLRELPKSCGESRGVRRISLEPQLDSELGICQADLVATRFRLVRTAPNLVMSLGDTTQDSLAHLAKKRRYNLLRQCRILEDRGAILKYYTSPPEVRDFISKAVPLAQLTYQYEIGRGIGNSAYHRDWILREAELGRSHCAILEFDGRPAAFQISVFRDERCVLLELGYDSRVADLSPGMSLLVMSLGDLVSRGIRKIDFGYGDAQYKRVLATEERSYLAGTAFPRSMGAAIEWPLVASAAWIQAVLVELVGGDRVRRVKSAWKRVLAK